MSLAFMKRDISSNEVQVHCRTLIGHFRSNHVSVFIIGCSLYLWDIFGFSNFFNPTILDIRVL